MDIEKIILRENKLTSEELADFVTKGLTNDKFLRDVYCVFIKLWLEEKI